MSKLRVLDVGNCDPDHHAIRSLLIRHFDVDVDRVMFVPEAEAAIGSERYALVFVNRRIFADDSDGMALVRAMQARSGEVPPIMLVSNFEESQAAAVASGAVRGFGKATLADVETVERLGAFLPRRETPAVRR